MTTTVLNNEEAAKLIGVTANTLRWWRHIGRGPKYIKYGDSKYAGVGYEVADIEAWKAERKLRSTSEHSPAARLSGGHVSNRHPVSSSTIPAPWLRSNG